MNWFGPHLSHSTGLNINRMVTSALGLVNFREALPHYRDREPIEGAIQIKKNELTT